jgi:hypothetical protein
LEEEEEKDKWIEENDEYRRGWEGEVVGGGGKEIDRGEG